MPSYKQVAEAARKVGTRVVAVSGEAPAVNETYLTSHGIAVERVLSQVESGVVVPQVPSLILVRRDGTVVDSWTGRADEAVARSAMTALSKN
jgi:hypothetical protein